MPSPGAEERHKAALTGHACTPVVGPPRADARITSPPCLPVAHPVTTSLTARHIPTYGVRLTIFDTKSTVGARRRLRSRAPQTPPAHRPRAFQNPSHIRIDATLITRQVVRR